MALKRLKPYLLAAALGLAGISASGAANAEETKPAFAVAPGTSAYGDPREYFLLGYEAVASYFLMTAIHESGHAMAANALGVRVSDFHPLPSYLDGGMAMGYTVYGEGYSKKQGLEKVVIASGGMLATRMAAEGLDALMNNADMHPRANQALAMLYFINRFDSVNYFLKCAIYSWSGNELYEGDDPQHIFNSVMGYDKLVSPKQRKKFARQMRKDQDIFYIIALSAISADISLDFGEIRNNFFRLWLIDPKEDGSQEGYDFAVDFSEGGAYVKFKYEF